MGMMPRSGGPGSGTPSYLRLGVAELRRRAEEAVGALADCRLCPRDCGVDRLAGKWSACKTGRYARVSSAFAHRGEEDCLRGWRGSGTIFFGHCNLRCVFCQNFDISQAIPPGEPDEGLEPGAIADLMLGLQARGCHNINFVTPEHVVPQVLEALVPAVERGLHLPIVYNTSAYDSLDSLAWFDGVVDIYMPDIKVWSPSAGKTYLKAEDYAERARAAVREMHRQVGPLRLDARGLARRGLIVRHLVMPGMLEETRAILTWVAGELGPDTYVNLMDQYHPAGKVSADRHPEIDRSLRSAEFAEARSMASELGLMRLDERRPMRPRVV
jgi:putative pyruvate formate lyase activating enzyme